MPNREVRVAIIGDPSSLQRALRTSETGLQSFTSRMQAVGSRMRSVGGSLTRSLTLPLLGFGVVAYRELSAGETALAQTQAVIESTGGAAQRTVDDIVELSGQLSEMSSVDDEDIQGLANTLLTFRQIAGPVFDEATTAALDLSVSMGTDLHAAAIQVGKALNDPVRGLTALQKVGVTFTEEQRNQIEAMVAFGDVAGAQRVILAELNAEFGGSAEALGGTLTGRLNRVKQRFEELAATILEQLTPVIEDLAGFIETLADKFDDLTPTQQKWVAGLLAAAFVAGPLISTMGALASAIGFLASPIGLVILAVAALGVAIFVLVSHWDQVKAAFQSFWQLSLSQIPGLQTAVLALGQAVRAVGSAFSFVTGLVQDAITYVLNFTQLNPLGGPLMAGIHAIQGAFQGLLNIIQSVIDRIIGVGSALASIDLNPIHAAQGLLSNPVGESASLIPRRRRGGSVSITGGITEAAMERAFGRALDRAVQTVVVANG